MAYAGQSAWKIEKNYGRDRKNCILYHKGMKTGVDSMSLAESLNWEQEEQCTSVFPRSVTNRKNQENLKLSEKKELLKKIADILAEEKWITSAELLVLKEKIEKYGGTL